MLGALLLGAGLLAAAPDDATPTPDDLKAYEAARASLGQGAEAHVKLALWCESHGLTAERVKHLALAVLADPTHAAARGLMGLVDYRGRWVRPDAVAEKIKADEELTAKLAEYNRRREGLRDTADAHAKLAQWCEENGLEPEAQAHLISVTRLDPSRDSAWKKLGLKKVNGRWVSPEQLARERVEAEAQREANRRWRPILAKRRAALRGKDPAAAAAAREALDAIDDFRAVSSVWAVFARGDADDQDSAVRVLAHIEGPASSRALAVLAVYSDSPDVRRTAAEVLKRRDGRDFIPSLIGLLREPIRYEVRPVNGPDLPGELFVEGQRTIRRRVYFNGRSLQLALAQIPPRLFDASLPVGGVIDPATAAILSIDGSARSALDPNQAGMRRDAEIAQRIGRIQGGLAEARQRLAEDVAQIEANNAQVRAVNERVLPVLLAVAEKDPGATPDHWRAWWADQQGYVYEIPATPTQKRVVTDVVSDPTLTYTIPRVVHSACFAAGTPVLTIDGPRPIETIRTGDRVLSQDVTTGRLSYTAVVAPVRNKPAATYRIKAGGDVVVATGIHRFWKAGHGWVMTRDLKPGDVLRTAGALATVESVESAEVQPVYNLELADDQTYFVGDAALLVHDHTPVAPVSRPFDAPSTTGEIAALK